jgi:DNA-binding transcriptional MerR regulator
MKTRTLRCGELAKAAGVSADTIRHYERLGVLPKAPRSLSGYRLYPESAVGRVNIIRRALRVGFTLAELADVLTTRDNGGAPCGRVLKLAHSKMKRTEIDIAALKEMRHYLRKVLADWDVRINESGGKRVFLLESLSNPVEAKSRPRRFRSS